ncbi:hypothetical protein ABW20_dc0102415 [Dactylellina cionopaga]|nr:hypothetical protein ABW20_dc0102415 [Dactylellina cionopaga]
MRAYGCGEKCNLITRAEFEKYYQREKDHVAAFAAAIEEIDYLQAEEKCPSTEEAFENVDPDWHIQPLIDKVERARLELKNLVDNDMKEEIERMNIHYDAGEQRMLLRNLYGVELLAQRDLNRVNAFLADLAHLSRLRYPNADDYEDNIHNLAIQISDGKFDGEQVVEYTVGARSNLRERFEDLISELQADISAYDVAITMDEITNIGQLEKWFPSKTKPENPNILVDPYRDVLGAMIRWAGCWVEGLEAGLEALKRIGPAPGEEKSRWGQRLGRTASRIGDSISGIVQRGWSRSATPERQRNGS